MIRVIRVIFTVLGLLLSINQLFNLKLLGFTIIENSYLYALMALFLPLVYLLYPASKKKGVQWHDWVLFLASIACITYFSLHGLDMIAQAWSFVAPPPAVAASIVMWVLIIEGVRRTSGLILSGFCLIFSFYPVYAPFMPGFLQGQGFSFVETATYHLMGVGSVLGIPMATFGNLLVGFIILGAALEATGGGKTFTDFASALFGQTRGGPAKVAIVGSALFGTMSGSVVANIVTIGSVTIPLMKKVGYPAYFAGAVEACSSTGGVLMPPVMGATAFIMANFLGIPYLSICLAAAIPSILYYLCIFIQVDGRAAKAGLKGLNAAEVPPLRQTLQGAWIYVVPIIALVGLLVYTRSEGMAPFYATAILLVLAMFRKESRFTLKSFTDFILITGKLLTELIVTLGGIGFIVGSLSVTGVGNSFARELVSFAGGSLPLLLLLGAIANVILGMGMTITACYIFLALVVAPALIQIGLNPIAVHLYVMYFGMASFITPPVAVASIVGASIAGAPQLKTGFQACKLGIAAYLVPFFFVLQPALVAQGPILQIAYYFITCAIGMVLISGTIEGYVLGIGKVAGVVRYMLAAAGILLAAPTWQGHIAGAVILVLALALKFIRGGAAKVKLESDGVSK